MIHNTFTHSFHSLIDPPNKDELLYALENAPLTKDQDFEWTLNCSVTTERLDLDLDVFFPSLDLFFKDLEANANLNISFNEVWSNTYSKGYFQELHDHLPMHLSGVFFLTDWKEGDAKFYFHHRHQSEISKEWIDLFLGRNNYFVEGKRGQVLLFPSWMMHGVAIHKSDNIRKTVAFNLLFNSK